MHCGAKPWYRINILPCEALAVFESHSRLVSLRHLAKWSGALFPRYMKQASVSWNLDVRLSHHGPIKHTLQNLRLLNCLIQMTFSNLTGQIWPIWASMISPQTMLLWVKFWHSFLRRRGVVIYENRWFRFPDSGFHNLREVDLFSLILVRTGSFPSLLLFCGNAALKSLLLRAFCQTSCKKTFAARFEQAPEWPFCLVDKVCKQTNK